MIFARGLIYRGGRVLLFLLNRTRLGYIQCCCRDLFVVDFKVMT